MQTYKRAVMVLVAAIPLVVVGQAAGNTNVGGFISTDTHWIQAESPYIVQDSIGVIGGATLTIDPGVEVRFEPGRAMVIDVGTLIAQGTAASQIRFTANQTSPSPQHWGYLQFSDNTVDATFDAEGAYISGSILSNTIVEYAGSTSFQGAVRAIGSSPYIANSTIQENAAGGIRADSADSIRMEYNIISGNTMDSGYGAGVRIAWSESSTLMGNTITGNTGSSWGGGLMVLSSANSILTDNIITENIASYQGGGVYLGSPDPLMLTGNIISGNVSSHAGGIFLAHSDSLTLTANTITGNTAINGNGGGVYFYNSSNVALTENIIAENTATGHGGAIYAEQRNDNVTFSRDRIIDNHTVSADGVGGIYIAGGSDGWNLSPVAPNQPVHLYGNDNYNFYNDNEFSGSFGYSDPGNVDARFVWWGTTDPSEIQAGIFDFFDYAANGVVFYDPYTIFNLGDFNDDGVVDDLDIDILSAAAVRGGDDSLVYDLDGDDDIDGDDYTYMIEEIIGSGPGTCWADGNLDNAVDVSDLSTWLSHRMTAGHINVGDGWSQGDWNGDGAVDVSDLSMWLSNRMTSYDSFGLIPTDVPEPATLSLLALGGLALLRSKRRFGG